MIVYFKVKQFERSFSDMALLSLVNTKNEIQGKTLLIQPLQNMGELGLYILVVVCNDGFR